MVHEAARVVATNVIPCDRRAGGVRSLILPTVVGLDVNIDRSLSSDLRGMERSDKSDYGYERTQAISEGKGGKVHDTDLLAT